MGSNIPQELGVRGARASAQCFGMPVAGGVQAFTGADAAIASLKGGQVYLLYATQDCWVNVDVAAAVGSDMFIPGQAKFLVPIMLGAPGTMHTLHVIQNSTGGNLFWTQMDDVG
jgi:hypothetical protein